MALDRSKYRQQIAERTKEVVERGSGSNFKTIFKPNLGDKVKFFKPKAGQHTVDIIPFECGEFMPIDSKLNPGEIAYLLDLYVHFNVGPMKDSYICMEKTYGKKCAVCDYYKEKTKEEQTTELVKLLKSIKAKQRAIYYVLVYDNPEEEKKGLQIWNAPHWKMQRIINELSVLPERGGSKVGGYVDYADPDVGKTVAFKIVGEQESTDYIGHRFIDRDYIIEDDVLIQANAMPLDTLLFIPEYDNVKAALFGMGVKVEEKKEEAPKQAELPLPSNEDSPVEDTPDVPASDAPVVNCPGGG